MMGFSHTIINGDGICQLLEKHGIIVFNDDNIDEFLKYIERGKNGTRIKN